MFSQPCADTGAQHAGGTFDLPIFSDTRALFPDPAGSLFVNTQRLYSAPWYLRFFHGPRARFRLELESPLAMELVQAPPFDPYLYVRNTQQNVRLMEVDPNYQDQDGFPFGMLLTSTWQPPLEYMDTAIAYPAFADFINSEGTSSLDWYNTPFIDYIVDIPGPDEWAW